MRAVRYPAPWVTPSVVSLPDPLCPPDGVVVRVGATGLCRSDWHAFAGHDPVPLPAIPGHELAGVIEAVGPLVRNWMVGQRVTVPFVLGCGDCEFCRAGSAQVCPRQQQPGFSLPGSFAELVALPAADVNLVALPDGVGDVAAASLGCRFATAFRALTGHGSVDPGRWVAVFGCGGVGLSAVMIAVALGARVVAVDPSAAALEAAVLLGAEVALDDSATAAVQIVEVTGGGAHCSIEAIGRPEAVDASVRSLRRGGRHIQVGLLLGALASTALPMDLVVARELSVHGSHGMAAADYPAMLAMVESGALRPELLVGRVIGLGEAGPALAAMGAPDTGGSSGGMTVIDPRLP